LAQGLDIACDDGIGSGFEAGVGGIAALEGSNLPGELGPAFKSVGSRDEELRIGQLGGRFGLNSALDASDFFALHKPPERRRESGTPETGLSFGFVIYIGCDPLGGPGMDRLRVGRGFQ
jgi:hypothetical protein